MKTLRFLLFVFAFSSLLVAQTDSTDTAPVEPVAEEPAVEAQDPGQPENEATESEASELSESALDSTSIDSTTLADDDTLEVEEPEMIEVSRDPDPVTVAALMNDGVFYWSNDGLENLGFDTLDYVTIEEPAIIAIKANDCLDIICHLLATDSTGVDYVILTTTDSSDFKIYNTITKVVVLDAHPNELATAFDAYLRSTSGMEYIAIETAYDSLAVPSDTTALTVDLPTTKSRSEMLSIRRKHFRSLDELFANPANLGRDYSTHTSWNLVPDFSLKFHNSLLTPGWYKEWLTVGGVWDADIKNDFLMTLNDDMALNIAPDFNSLIGFRIGSFGLNIAAKTHIKVIMPGSLLGLPFQDISLLEPIENGGLEIETIPFASKTSLSYAHPVKTPYGNAKVGASVNFYEAAGYLRMVSEDFTVLLTQDSIFVTGTGEGWGTTAGIEGRPDSLLTDDFNATESLSKLSLGFDLGAIVDLQPRIGHEVELQMFLRNIGASYKWSGLSHEKWSFEQRMPAPGNIETDSTEDGEGIEQYQTTETTVISEDEDFSVSVPTVFNLTAIYQPHPRVLLGLGIEKALIDEDWFEYSSNLEFNYQLNVYATSFWDFSYHKQTVFGDPIHSFGSGFHFGFLDTGLSISFINGLNTNAKGMGFGWTSSFHF